MKQARDVQLNIMPFWKEGDTVEKVAKELGVNPGTISGLRKGTYKGRWNILVNCSRYFGVPIEKLLVIEKED